MPSPWGFPRRVQLPIPMRALVCKSVLEVDVSELAFTTTLVCPWKEFVPLSYHSWALRYICSWQEMDCVREFTVWNRSEIPTVFSIRLRVREKGYIVSLPPHTQAHATSLCAFMSTLTFIQWFRIQPPSFFPCKFDLSSLQGKCRLANFAFLDDVAQSEGVCPSLNAVVRAPPSMCSALLGWWAPSCSQSDSEGYSLCPPFFPRLCFAGENMFYLRGFANARIRVHCYPLQRGDFDGAILVENLNDDSNLMEIPITLSVSSKSLSDVRVQSAASCLPVSFSFCVYSSGISPPCCYSEPIPMGIVYCVSSHVQWDLLCFVADLLLTCYSGCPSCLLITCVCMVLQLHSTHSSSLKARI